MGEMNGLLNHKEMSDYQQTFDKIIKSNPERRSVKPGNIYSFQLRVTQYSNDNHSDILGYGESTLVTISVVSPPLMTPNSLDIEPNCNQNYRSISRLLSISHTVSIFGVDSENHPLSYQFGYIEDDDFNPLFTSSMSYECSSSNIFLPVGRFEVFTNIMDSKWAMSQQTLECYITLSTYSECLDFEHDILHSIDSSSITDQQKYSFIFQQASIYLQYLYKYYHVDADDDDCIENSLDQILGSLNKYISTTLGNDNLCGTQYPIDLAQVMILWMNLVSSEQSLIMQFYVEPYQDLDDGT